MAWSRRLCHEPRVALAVLNQMLAPYLAGGRLTLLLDHRVVGAEVQGDRVRRLANPQLAVGSGTHRRGPVVH